MKEASMQNTQITPEKILADLNDINTLVYRLLTDYNRTQLADVKYGIEDELRRVLGEISNMDNYSRTVFGSPIPLDRFRDIQNGLDFVARLQPMVQRGGSVYDQPQRRDSYAARGGGYNNNNTARGVYGQASTSSGYSDNGRGITTGQKSNSKYAEGNYVDKTPSYDKKSYTKKPEVAHKDVPPEKGHEYPFLASTGIQPEKVVTGEAFHYELFGTDELTPVVHKDTYTFKSVEIDSSDKFKTMQWITATSDSNTILGQDRRVKTMVLKIGPTFDPKQIIGLVKSFKEKSVLTIDELKMFLNATKNTAIASYIDILLTKRFTELCVLGGARSVLTITSFIADIHDLLTTVIPNLKQVTARNRINKAIDRTMSYAKSLIENIAVDIETEHALVSIYDIIPVIIIKDPTVINFLISNVSGIMTISEDSCAVLYSLLTSADTTDDIFGRLGMVRLIAFDALQFNREYVIYQKDTNYTIKG